MLIVNPSLGLFRHRTGNFSDDSILGDGIVDRPSTVKVVDGAGNLKSETDYSYDAFQSWAIQKPALLLASAEAI